MMDSRNTSIKQVPALHKWAVNNFYIMHGSTILDYGCGKYPNSAIYLHDAQDGLHVDSYDKYWRDVPEYLEALSRGQYDTVLCANVLNVIQDDGELDHIIADLSYTTDVALISVYEGDRSGDGRETTRGYQRNLPAREYEKYLRDYFTVVVRRGNIYICSNNEDRRNEG